MARQKATAEAKQKANTDIFTLNQQFQDMMEKNWSKFFDNLLASEAYAEGMGNQLNNYLNFASMWKTTMAKSLANMNLLTVDDLTRLAGQISNLEQKLECIEERLELIYETIMTPEGKGI